MKNYKITCPSIFIADLIYFKLDNLYRPYKFTNGDTVTIININGKIVSMESAILNLEDLYSYFAGTPFEILIQELDDNGNLVKQRMTP